MPHATGKEQVSRDVTLVRMTREDLDAYLALEKKVESRTYTAAQDRGEAEEEFAEGPMYFFVLDGAVVGAVSCALQEDGSVYLNGLSVDPAYQGQGIGRRALELVLDMVREAPRVWLVVHPENERALALYRSLGFEEVGRKENFHGDNEPRVVLSRDRPSA